MMRTKRWILSALLLATAPAAAQEMDADRAIEGGGVISEGWMARTDRGQNFDNVRFIDEMGALEISVGPAIIAYREGNTASGEYRVSATFDQLTSKGHGHGAGLIVGGDDLQGPDQVYTYFLVRGDGAFLVKTRKGEETSYLMPWEMHDAVKVDETGTTSNELAIQVRGEDMIFWINRHEVHREKAADVYADGIYGIRLNHNLDMKVHGLKLERH
jgi:hypothetical protein